MLKKLKISAIYTTYYPSAGFRNRIQGVITDSAVTIIVDNTPGGYHFEKNDISGAVLIQDGLNKGLGAAINLGIAEALKQGCNAVVLFDQDSSPQSGFIYELCSVLSAVGNKSIVGPLLLDDKEMPGFDFNAKKNNSISLKSVTCIATSGMCFYIDNLGPGERFTEDFFLDFVDFDWCWRMRDKGWSVYKINSLWMPHRLGIEQREFFGLKYHVPTPFRHYFQFRDTLYLVFLKHVPTYSRIRLFSILLPKLLIYPFLLDNGFERFKWMVIGIGDAFGKVKGIGAAATKLQKFH